MTNKKSPLGASLRRFEDPQLVRGAGTYVDDIRLESMVYLAVVRSPFAHAIVGDIDTAEAAGSAGVQLIMTPDQVADVVMPPAENPRRNIPRRFPLVQGRARMVGDPLAAVIADSPALARDAADLVFADLDPLDSVGDPEEAIEAPPLYESMASNVAYDRSGGDAEAVRSMDGAIVLEGTVEHPRLAPVPLETRGIIAQWDENKLTVYLSSQAPHLMREELAKSFDLDLEDVRVITPFVGGGFGCKFDLAEEEYLAIVAARRLGRPVKWIETRREHFLAIGHGRSQRHHYRVVADANGKIKGLWIDSIVDIGCRQRYLPATTVTPKMGVGNYAITEYAWRQRGVYTNRAPRGIYRGAGRPEATLTIERIVDRVAAAAGIDPAEMRRRNFIAPDAFPYEAAGGYIYDSGRYSEALDRLLENVDYDRLRAWQTEQRAAGKVVGIGLAAYVEVCAFQKWGAGRVEVHPDGTVTCSAGTLDQGQGHRTAFPQVAASALGIDVGLVRLDQGDTATSPYDTGTSGSRSLSLGGSGVFEAAEAVANKIRHIAAHILGVHESKIELVDGNALVVGTEDSVSWKEVVDAAYGGTLPDDIDARLVEERRSYSSGQNFPFGVHLATVEIDPQTGTVSLLDMWAVDDVGNVVNPMIVDGQRHGGLAQGIGQVLYEEVRYDDDGNLVTSSLMDYLVPTAGQIPRFHLDRTVTPSPTNALGVKGVGEAGAIGGPPAVLNAVVDALGPYGVDDLTLPLRPEKIWSTLANSANPGL